MSAGKQLHIADQSAADVEADARRESPYEAAAEIDLRERLRRQPARFVGAVLREVKPEIATADVRLVDELDRDATGEVTWESDGNLERYGESHGRIMATHPETGASHVLGSIDEGLLDGPTIDED